ncbi:diguanylate cyclase [Salinimonas sp. HHU 13199]|uniref:diguanylate cyclase n=1 Tax=Salinimonas profundi TaxID=2729140 RepID=A0ABR8LRK8_9ALTE|nr:GGDEF domain-containing protein [Salinimonas profundi]MBD3586775.1 diguanylate cyclase [Salinimonas profundi]
MISKYDAYLVGHYGMQNCGDDALLLASLYGAQSVLGCQKMLVSSYDKTLPSGFSTDITTLYEKPAFKGQNRLTHYISAARSKRVIFGGGSMLRTASDINQKRHMMALSSKAKSMALVVGIEPFVYLNDELAREERELGIILLDIDDFKKLNDTFGHEHGDRCLKAVAQAVSINCKRPGDRVIRFGGEEFLVMLPRTGEKGVRRIAEDIVNSVAKIQLAYSDNVISRVTVSVGATWRDNMNGQELDEMIHEADMAMYSSKRAGKNRFTLAPPKSVGERKKYRCRPVMQGNFINSVAKNRAILAKHKL